MSYIRGRFNKDADKLAARYTASIPFDWRLYPYDIEGSVAHAKMLAKQGLISPDRAIRRGRGTLRLPVAFVRGNHGHVRRGP